MKIIGGSFGVGGAAYISGTTDLAIAGARDAIYRDGVGVYAIPHGPEDQGS